MKISVVIPTYNRAEVLSRVLDSILESSVDEFDEVEVVVVDDGSEVPASEIVEKKTARKPFRLRCVAQKNSGPAAARNRGFKESSNDVVLFIDDDLLVSPDLLRVHYDSHQESPGSVVFGRSPLYPEGGETPAKRYFDSLQTEFEKEMGLIKRSDLASGNISFERRLFPSGKIYNNSMVTPGAEEFELAVRLKDNGIPIFQNNAAYGWHLQSSDIEEKFKQEYKYGISVAEALVKVPNLMKNERFRNLVDTNLPASLWFGGIRSAAKRTAKLFIGFSPVFRLLLFLTRLLERNAPGSAMLPMCYRTICGIGLFRGIRDGVGRFREEL